MPRAAMLAALIASGGLGTAALAPATAQAQSKTDEVVVTVRYVKAVDKPDVFSQPDFFARITINGRAQSTPIIKQRMEFSPFWRIRARVPRGKADIKLELFDKDLTKNEPIDINRLPNKRDLDFTIDTRSCRIGGFASPYRCGWRITRTGDQRKAATITFSVGANRR